MTDMVDVSFQIPQTITDALPEEDDAAAKDMKRAVEGWEKRISSSIEDDERSLVEVVDHLEQRLEQYDEFIVELRAWGQSPIYAMVWRDLHASLIQQLLSDPEIANRIDREQHARIVDDGIRFGGS